MVIKRTESQWVTLDGTVIVIEKSERIGTPPAAFRHVFDIRNEFLERNALFRKSVESFKKRACWKVYDLQTGVELQFNTQTRMHDEPRGVLFEGFITETGDPDVMLYLTGCDSDETRYIILNPLFKPEHETDRSDSSENGEECDYGNLFDDPEDNQSGTMWKFSLDFFGKIIEFLLHKFPELDHLYWSSELDSTMKKVSAALTVEQAPRIKIDDELAKEMKNLTETAFSECIEAENYYSEKLDLWQPIVSLPTNLTKLPAEKRREAERMHEKMKRLDARIEKSLENLWELTSYFVEKYLPVNDSLPIHDDDSSKLPVVQSDTSEGTSGKAPKTLSTSVSASDKSKKSASAKNLSRKPPVSSKSKK